MRLKPLTPSSRVAKLQITSLGGQQIKFQGNRQWRTEREIGNHLSTPHLKLKQLKAQVVDVTQSPQLSPREIADSQGEVRINATFSRF